MKISKPTLLIDKKKCYSNISKMVNKSLNHNLNLRPHFKTHQSAIIGKWFKDFGIKSITVSSVSMAGYFEKQGWKNISIAFPVNILEIDQINKLASKIKLNILFESKESVKFLQKHLVNKTGGYIKIDAGYGRTGIDAINYEKIDEVLVEVNKCSNIIFKGFITHSGHTYQANSIQEIESIHTETISKLISLKNKYKKEWNNLDISIGNTPSCSISENFTGVDEIRPGNFVFYDLMQLELGVCTFDEIAVVLACPVVAKHKERNEIVIYGGAVHLSKEYLFKADGEKTFGLIVELAENKWNSPIKKAYVSSLSQEHGIVKIYDDHFEKINIGDIIGIIPVHSCLTNDLMRSDAVIL